MYSTIIHPTDLSEASFPALKSAQSLAKELRAKLIVYFIAHPPLVASGETLTDPKTNEARNIAEELESHQPSEPGVDRELRIIVTDPSTRVKTLLEFLSEAGGDLLVLGMHKKSGVAGWFGHSITEDVVRHADCAVLVVKHDDDAEPMPADE